MAPLRTDWWERRGGTTAFGSAILACTDPGVGGAATPLSLEEAVEFAVKATVATAAAVAPIYRRRVAVAISGGEIEATDFVECRKCVLEEK